MTLSYKNDPDSYIKIKGPNNHKKMFMFLKIIDKIYPTSRALCPSLNINRPKNWTDCQSI